MREHDDDVDEMIVRDRHRDRDGDLERFAEIRPLDEDDICSVPPR